MRSTNVLTTELAVREHLVAYPIIVTEDAIDELNLLLRARGGYAGRVS